MPRRLALLALVLVAACKRGAAGECGPLTVTVDGAAVGGFGHGKAVLARNGSDETLTLDLFGDDTVTCAQLMSPLGRLRGAGEQNLRAFIAGGSFGTGVGLDVYQQMGLSVRRIGPAPAQVGDRVAMCVEDARFTPIAGAAKDKAVRVDGRLDGTFCGIHEFGEQR